MKGELKMNKSVTNETVDILKRLAPKTQEYFMTLVRVAEVAENGVKNTLTEQPRNPTSRRSVV